MSVKKEMMDRINKKAQSIRDKRFSAANKDVYKYVFDYFKNTQPIEGIPDGSFTRMSTGVLIQQLKTIDPLLRDVNPHVVETGGLMTLQGVRVLWSTKYANENSCSDSLYIDIVEMVLLHD